MNEPHDSHLMYYCDLCDDVHCDLCNISVDHPDSDKPCPAKQPAPAPSVARQQREAERAVIEAAKETVRDSYRPELLYDAERFDRLKAAVEALAELEGE